VKIKRLRLTGFKSFVEPAELRIEPGLTGVVGPNGCGKSNLLEAIRWVMGESSPKSMRGGGMDDVIFAGTSSRPARDFAEVALVADLEGAALTSIGDGDSDGELEVIRRIERGQGSAYRANGRDVRAKDISLIFADAATGAHSPALVSQGKIAAVISAKPAERRQMLEEAAGIAGLHVRRKDAEQKLRATEANLERLDTIIGDMAQRAGQLRRQARAAERYTSLSERIRIAEARMIYARWRDAAAAADTAREEAEAASRAVRAAQEAQEAASAYRVEAAQALERRRTASREANDAASAVAQKLARLTAEADAHDRRAADLAEQLQRIADDRAREGSLAEDAAAAIARLDREAEALGERQAAAQARLPELGEAIATSAGALRDAEVELAQLRADLAGQAADRRIAEAGAASAREALAQVERERDSVAARMAALGDEAALSDALRTANARATAANAAATAAETALADAQAALDTALAGQAESERAHAAARTALATIESERAALAKALATPGDAARAIDRITAAKGYEHALAAALGDDLDAPIGGASGWLGAAPSPGDPALPHGTESLADHVDAPPELARRLAQVAVAPSDEGQALAIGQRLVTRDGRLRRWDGFVATGGGAVGAERLVRRNRLNDIEREQPALRAALDTAAAHRTAIVAEADAARQALVEARAARSHSDEELRTALADADRAQSALDRWREGVEALEERRAELATRLTDARATLARAEAALAALPAADASSERLAASEARSEATRTAASEAREAEQAQRSALAALRERRAGIAAEAEAWRARSGEAATRIAKLAERQASLAAEQAKANAAPATLREDIAALEAGRDELAARRDAMQAEEEAATRALAEREDRLAAARETLSSAREARAGADARAEAQDLRRVEMGRVSNERFECPPPLLPRVAEFDADDVADPGEESRMHEKLTADRERIGPVNLVAAQELDALDGEHAQSLAEAEELRQAVARLRGSIGSLNREGRIRLKAAFEAVDTHFQRLFTTLFNGGAAHLELVDSDDPLEAGLEIMAQPPGKKLASLTLLSGGEQALTAIALIFALFLTNPAPICVLDEVDAPLDDANIERFCDLLDKMVAETRTRYLIVTHNAVTMSRMHRLFGVTMVEQGVSRLVSVDLEAAEELVAA
jgi:chromosome segregation protein